MTNKGKEFLKIETKASTDENSNVNGWQELSDQAPEYWSEEAMKNRPIKELYPWQEEQGETEEDYVKRLEKMGKHLIPKEDSETDQEYDAKMQNIGDLTLERDENIPYKVSKKYPDGYPYGKVINRNYSYDEGANQGYKFVERQPEVEYFAKDQFIGQALVDAAKARVTGELKYDVSTPNVFSSQQDIARHYNGPLSYIEQTEQDGIFQNSGADQYDDVDRDKVERKRAEFEAKDRESSENEALRIAGKMFEGFFFPLVEQGFFDLSRKKPAAFVPTSEYDDYFNKADAAAVITIPIIRDEKLVGLEDVPVAFDLTTGSGDGKIEGVKDRFKEKHGLTELKYPSTCLGEDLPLLDDIPHFVICLPRQQEAREFETSLANHKMPSYEIQFLINYQIREQAELATEYWAGRPGEQEKAEQFAKINNYFLRRQEACRRKIGEPIEAITDRHTAALSYLAGLKKEQP